MGLCLVTRQRHPYLAQEHVVARGIMIQRHHQLRPLCQAVAGVTGVELVTQHKLRFINLTQQNCVIHLSKTLFLLRVHSSQHLKSGGLFKLCINVLTLRVANIFSLSGRDFFATTQALTNKLKKTLFMTKVMTYYISN